MHTLLESALAITKGLKTYCFKTFQLYIFYSLKKTHFDIMGIVCISVTQNLNLINFKFSL
jgi:hypothetical protein